MTTTLTGCGPALDHCSCRHRGPMPRTAAQIRADHRAAVNRAKRSGWGLQPIPGWLFLMFNPGSVEPWQALPAQERVA